ncbi:MAG: hypothetical protein HOC25_00685 [Flavobacteriales bacterium]|nr:hypothetical protein [Flavobacteriales bacterium]
MGYEFNNKRDKRKGWATTISVHILLLLLFSIYGLSYSDPPPEMGIPINFGYDDQGGGNSVAAPAEPLETPVVAATEAVTETAVTQDIVDAVALPDEPEKSKPEEVKPPEPTPTPEPVKPEPDQQPDNNLLRATRPSSQTAKSQPSTGSGQGRTTGGGDLGKPTGSLASQGEGLGGNGNSGNYQLGNRIRIVEKDPTYGYNGEGVVIVKITVSRSGKVVTANGNSRGTTAPTALIKRAEAAAMQTTFNSDPSAAQFQSGSITYRFSKT